MSKLPYPDCPVDRICDPSDPIPKSCQSYSDEILKRGWIVVDTIAERDRLCRLFKIHGKIVLVNKVDVETDGTIISTPRCYRWNQDTQSWDDFVLGGSNTPSPATPEQWVSF